MPQLLPRKGLFLWKVEMTNTQALREKVEALANSANALLSEKGSLVWSKDEQAKFDNIADEIQRAQDQLKADQKMRDLDADAFFKNVAPSKSVEMSAKDVLGIYLRNGKNVTPDQAAAIHNAMSTSTSSEGGYTVPSEIAAMVVDAMKAFGGMREVSQILTTAGGNDLNYPTSDGTSEVGEIVAQNGAASAGDITFGTVAVNPFKYGSKKIALPIELVQDSAIDVVSFVVNRLATRLARITNQHYTTGDGSSKPYGVMARAATGKTGATGTATTVTYDDLVDLIYSVNSAYRPNARFMLKDLSVAVIRKLKDTTGRPIWTPGDAEGIAGGVPATICGYAFTVNDDVATMAANAKSIAFGDFSQFVIRDVQNSTSMLRFDDSAFALNGQVGFVGWTRTGSNLLDTAAVKVFVNSAT
jgi:HK97 family phage major capsid protein